VIGVTSPGTIEKPIRRGRSLKNKAVRSWTFSKGKKVFERTAAIIVFLALWEVLPRLGILDRTFVPPFSVVARAFVSLLASGELLKNAAVSFQRAFSGFVLAALVAIPLGFLVGWFKAFEKYVDPLLETFRTTSPLSLFPVFILILGIGEASKTAIVFWGCVWPLLLTTISGVKSADPLLIKAARVMGASRVDIFRKVILPGAYPSLFSGLRLSASVAIIMVTAAEMIGANSGLGYLMIYSQQVFNVPDLYVAIIALALLGLSTNYFLVWLEKRVHVWKQEVVV
jgi:NitT/TauT family transport system permease protein